MRLAQDEWQKERLGAIFKTKAAFNKARRSTKTVYNSRSAHMKARGLNAVDVKDDWRKVKNGSEDGAWLAEAKRLGIEGSSLVTFYRNLLSLHYKWFSEH